MIINTNLNIFSTIRRTGVSIDAAVSTYQQAVIGAGGTFQAGEISLLSDEVSFLKTTTVWDKIVEWAPIMGGFNGSYVKLKYATTPTLVSDGTANFVSGDYSNSTGLTSLTTTKRIKVGAVVDSIGLGSQNLSVVYLHNPNALTAGSKLILSDRSSPVKLNLTNSSLNLNNGTTIINHLNDINLDGTIRPFFVGMLCGAQTDYYIDMKNIVSPASQASPSMTLTNELYLFHSGSAYNQGNIGALVIAQTLTPSEYLILYSSLNRIARFLGRVPAAAPSLMFFGDSITNGSAATSGLSRFSYLYSLDRNIREISDGIVASPFQSSGSYQQPGGFARRSDIARYIADNPSLEAVVMYGVNDITLTSNGVYGEQLSMLAQTIKEISVAGGSTMLSSIPFINTGSATLITNYRAVTQLTAKMLQIPYVDMYSYMQSNGGVSLLTGDNIHPNDTGHGVIADGLGTATTPSPDGAMAHLSLFNAPNNTDIGSYTPEFGNVWVPRNSSSWAIQSVTTRGVLPYRATSITPNPTGNDWNIDTDISANNFTMYVVASKLNSGDGVRFIVRRTDTSNYVDILWGAANAMTFRNMVAGTPTNFGTISVAPVQATLHLFKIVLNGTDISVTVDFGTTYTATIPTTQSGTRIGIGQYTTGAGNATFRLVYAHQ